MDVLSALEDVFEKYFEGFFRKKFSGDLQPVEIAKKLARQMEKSRSVSISTMYVPNRYLVYVSAHDYDRLSPYWQAIREELAHFLQDEAAKNNYAMVGAPVIDLFTAADITPGSMRVTSEFTEPSEEEPPAENLPGETCSDTSAHTRVFSERPSLLPDLERIKRTRCEAAATLTVIDGVDVGVAMDIAGGRVNIGRRPGNEFCLTDMNVSRLHAYIVWENNSHVIYDAKSLNGTYVNEQRVTRKILKTGDKIKLGNTVIAYEVK